jgi:hypothetical protein
VSAPQRLCRVRDLTLPARNPSRPDLDGDQLGQAAGVVDGFHHVLGGEFAHEQGELDVERHYDGARIDALNVLRGVIASAFYFYDEFGVSHVVATPFCGYCFDCCFSAAQGFRNLPHSRQRALSREVINPQNGHILCAPAPAICGLSRRVQ